MSRTLSLPGDDKYKHIVEKLPQLAAVVSGLLYKEGLEVDGVKNTFKILLEISLVMVSVNVCFMSIYIYY
jgi:hypothetical protein